MRARFAYISSLGTTAILVAAALLMLVVVGAIVGFRGWPGGGDDGGGVQSVPLAPGGASKQVALVRHGSAARGVERRARTRTAGRSAAVSTSGLVKAKATGPRVVPGLVMVPVASSPMQPEADSPGRSTPEQQPFAGDPETDRPVGDPPEGPGPLPGGAGELVPVQLPDPSPPPPSADQVTTMVGTLLTGGSPPPPALSTILPLP
jgi:hypothetical protein